MKTKHSIDIQEFKEFSPVDVAKMLNISYNKAKQLMDSNTIRCWNSNDNIAKPHYKTNITEIRRYQEKQLQKRDYCNNPEPKQHFRRISETNSNLTMKEFLKNEFN